VEDATARNDPTSAPAQVAELREIQAALAEDEALLSFQLWRPEVSLFAPWPGLVSRWRRPLLVSALFVVVVAIGGFAVRRARRARPAFHGRPEARSLQV